MNQLEEIKAQLEHLLELVENEKEPASYDKKVELAVIHTRLDRIILHYEECIRGKQ